jgi:hypothetical protein
VLNKIYGFHLRDYRCTFDIVKKALIFLMAILYVTVTSGVIVNIHYCMGNIASINYGADEKDSCEKCGMKQKKDCCHTEHKLLKSSQEHLLSNNHIPIASWVAIVSPLFPGFQEEKYRSGDHYYSLYHSPPDPRKNLLRMYNCVFRV